MGRCFSGDLRQRVKSAVEHRLGCGWAKFRNLASILTNKQISIKLRLRLFDAVVTPTVLYALDTTPLTSAYLHKLDGTQRCMLRRMVGWICYETDSWEERGHRMKARMDNALKQHPIEQWSVRWASRKQQLEDLMPSAPFWTRTAYQWDLRACSTNNHNFPYRRVGRPRVRW